MPLILGISMKYESFEGTHMQKYKDEDNLWGFIFTYMHYGFACMVGDDGGNVANSKYKTDCSHSYFFIIIYVISLFTFQLCLVTLMQYKKAVNTRMIFSCGVPLTILAFFLGYLSLTKTQDTQNLMKFLPFDGIAMALACIGVLMYNMVEEPTQKVSIEKIK